MRCFKPPLALLIKGKRDIFFSRVQQCKKNEKTNMRFQGVPVLKIYNMALEVFLIVFLGFVTLARIRPNLRKDKKLKKKEAEKNKAPVFVFFLCVEFFPFIFCSKKTNRFNNIGYLDIFLNNVLPKEV